MHNRKLETAVRGFVGASGVVFGQDWHYSKLHLLHNMDAIVRPDATFIEPGVDPERVVCQVPYIPSACGSWSRRGLEAGTAGRSPGPGRKLGTSNLRVKKPVSIVLVVRAGSSPVEGP